MARISALVQLFLSALGTPMSWHKTHTGSEVTYLGFSLNVQAATVEVPPDKVEKAREFLVSSISFGVGFGVCA